MNPSPSPPDYMYKRGETKGYPVPPEPWYDTDVFNTNRSGSEVGVTYKAHKVGNYNPKETLILSQL